MTPEQRMWQTLRPRLSGAALLDRVENSAVPGMPDLHFCRRDGKDSGWIELKTIEKWTGKALQNIKHLRADQVNWIRTRADLSVTVYLLLWVRDGDEWLWIPGCEVCHEMRNGGMAREKWHRIAVASPFNPAAPGATSTIRT